MYLHQNDTFGQLAINGVGIPAGVYTCAQLTNAFPTNFPPLWNTLYGSTNFSASGSITVLNSLIVAPTITAQPPAQAEEFAGAPMTYSVAGRGNAFSCQWYINGVAMGGATNASFSFSSLAGTNTYSCILSNAGGVASTVVQTNVAVVPPTIVTFDDDTNWTLQGVAIAPTLISDVLTLTDNNLNEAASAFYNIAQYVEGFNASFTYTAGGSLAADGVTFTIQNAPTGPATLGGGGGNLGYFGINHSLSFQLNIYTNATGGIGFGFGTNGTIARPYLSTAPVDLASGDAIGVNLYYQQGHISITLTDTVSTVTFTTNMTIADAVSVLGDTVGYVGFTGADGGSAASQFISNFNFVPAAFPMLSVASGPGSQATIAWSGGTLTNMVLQSSSQVNGPWANTGATPGIVGNNYQVTITPAGGAQFFRLASP
jgi:hypothetical protein